jgi:hypothetical protein
MLEALLDVFKALWEVVECSWNPTVLKCLSETAYASFVRESLWGWPMSLTVHAFGNGAVIGLSFIIALRLLGFFRTIPYASLSRLFPVIWIGVFFQVLSGASLWMTKPDKYVAGSYLFNGDVWIPGMFDFKFTFVVIGAGLTGFLQYTIKREAAAWQSSGTVSSRWWPPGGIQFAVATALAWAAVLMTGRLTAYLGTLYS